MKITLYIIFGGLAVLSVACLVYALFKAEEGFQDENGYHSGKEGDNK